MALGSHRSRHVNGWMLRLACALVAIHSGPLRTYGQAAAPYVVKQLWTENDRISASSAPSDFIQIGGVTFFVASDQVNGRELWKTDGTPEGTVLVRDTLPGNNDNLHGPENLFNFNGLLLFSADDGEHGRELWRSDGTASGTYMLADIEPGAIGSNPQNFIQFGNQVVLNASISHGVIGIMRTDGTQAGTYRISPWAACCGPDGACRFVYPQDCLDQSGWLQAMGSSCAPNPCIQPRQFICCLPNNQCRFMYDSACASQHGTLMPAGSTCVPVSPCGVLPAAACCAVGACTIATAADCVAAGGSPRGAHAACEPNPCVCLVYPCCLPNGQCQILSDADCAAASGTGRGQSVACTPNPCTDPASACTERFVRCCMPDGSCTLAQDNAGCAAAGGVGSGQNTTCEAAAVGNPCAQPRVGCCRTNGACSIESLSNCMSAGWMPGSFSLSGGPNPCFSASCPATQTSESFSIGGPVAAIGQTLLIYGQAGNGGFNGLWSWDGSVARYNFLRSFSTNSTPQFLTQFNGFVLFAVSDGVSGVEWWRTDGTPAGTQRVADINPGAGDGVIDGTNGNHPRLIDGFMYFLGNDGVNGVQVWRTNGTPGGTTRLTAFSNLANVNAGPILGGGGKAYIFAPDASGSRYALWRLDTNSPPGATVVLGNLSGNPTQTLAVGGTLYFSASIANSGPRGLFSSDGTPAGTGVFHPVPDTTNVFPQSLFWNTALQRLLFAEGEPWISDGTVEGTHQLRDLATSVVTYRMKPAGGDRLIFAAPDAAVGLELFTSDGTPSGTTLLKDVNPGTPNSLPQNLTSVDIGDGLRRVYFTADSPGFPQCLWVTDGTTAGTHIVGDQDALSRMVGPNATRIGLLDGYRYFPAGNSVTGMELYRSNGTESGSGLVYELPGAGGVCDLGSFENASGNGFLCFTGRAGLYRTDGTSAGTYLLKAYYPNQTGSIRALVAFHGQVMFFYQGRLWRTDGSVPGTVAVDTLDAPPYGQEDVTVIGEQIVFSAINGGTSGFGRELWVSNATPDGYTRLSDINPGSADSSPGPFLPFDGQFVFMATSATRRGVYKSDGTPAGTTLAFSAADFNQIPNGIQVWNNRLLILDTSNNLWVTPSLAQAPIMLATGGITESAAIGNLLYYIRGQTIWVTDGTPEGTREAVPSVEYGTSTYQPLGLFAAGEYLYFRASGSHGIELYRTTGAEGEIATLAYESRPGPSNGGGAPVWMNGRTMYLLAPDRFSGGGLYQLNIDAPLPAVATRLGFGPEVLVPFTIGNPVAADGFLYYTEQNSACCLPTQLFRTDGTNQGTSLMATMGRTPLSNDYGLRPLMSVNGQFLLTGYQTPTGTELYRADAVNGATLIRDLIPGPQGWGPYDFGKVGERMFYGAQNTAATQGFELCVTDATFDGTRVVKDIRPDNFGSNPRLFIDLGGIALFVADDGTHGEELWRSDGTDTGTWLVKDIVPGTGSPSITGMVKVGDRVFFAASDAAHGRELWASDGTEAGTAIIRDIRLGSSGSNPTWLTPTGDHLHFVAYTPETGPELWISDGTPSGTLMLFDLEPGPGGPNIDQLTVAGNQLYFLATVSPGGTSLWSYNWPAGLRAVCRGDYDRNGSASLQDLFTFLTDWFTLASRADINGSGQVTVQDIFDFLTAWFAGCG